jgi:hypothetical protein
MGSRMSSISPTDCVKRFVNWITEHSSIGCIH